MLSCLGLRILEDLFWRELVVSPVRTVGVHEAAVVALLDIVTCVISMRAL